MRVSTTVVVGVACATILAVGYAVSPKELPTLELVVPAGEPADAGESTASTASIVGGAGEGLGSV